MGRIPELLQDPDLTKRICAMVAQGCTYKDACVANGINESTLYRYLDLAKDPAAAEHYRKFSEELARARAMGKAALVGVVHRAGRGEPVFDKEGNIKGYKGGDWKASQWLLSIRDPEHYSQSQKHIHSGPAGKPIEVTTYRAINLPAMTEEEDEEIPDAMMGSLANEGPDPEDEDDGETSEG